MNLTLTRTNGGLYGFFGNLTDENGKYVADTLEHAYKRPNGTWSPKLPPGKYTCKLGEHRLSNLIPFLTYEVLGVPDFDGSPVRGILFHSGNVNNDSEGCILVGGHRGTNCILDSRAAFVAFMQLQEDETFELTVN